MSCPEADALRAPDDIPLIFATSYEAQAIPKACKDVPRAEKPVELRQATFKLIG